MSSEERLKILKMVADGVITIDDAEQLLDALGESEAVRSPDAPWSAEKKGKWLRVIVTDAATGKTKVNIRVPSGLISAGMRLGSKFVPEMDGVDTAEILNALNNDVQGKFIDVVDEEDGEHVQIMIE